MKYIHKISLFLLIWLLFTAFTYVVLVGIGWFGILFVLIAEIPSNAFVLVALAVGLLCGMVAITDDEGDA
ncbi:hypothetical protein QJV38_06960 [Listeria cossartiae subsp. cayugensis]|uniref:DUF2929 family protein n=1 Tax=Listeria cossartiae subsp. cayugensis TaxID=2713505 RepID=A0ABU2IIV3_9LIST|nr:hypothetical protein [Listeria cossartiae]MDT0064617.1 hypothetical protein [Listeria cossartiae subsp. cayugensis]MDT0079779.1 hypothetical protein [Listeria cossartiae subsp. cayugensis]MDT0082615.1 hypothetical protein [Listeria cossartiae subsp. cayugensis]MDT0086850.1 hypothetical protein [Listeria cossartiae subsp. cayugensis]MDT0099232.1 hypothetical protein [Listeria cossartiae subsp. cayugensis]